GRAASFFFMHLGSLVAVVVYFHLCGASGYSVEGVRSALLTALVVKSGYMALASWRGDHNHFDFGIWPMLRVGTTGAYRGAVRVAAALPQAVASGASGQRRDDADGAADGRQRERGGGRARRGPVPGGGGGDWGMLAACRG